MNEVFINCNNTNGFIYQKKLIHCISILEKIYKSILRWYLDSAEGFLTDQLVLIKTDSVCFVQVQTQYQFVLFNSLSFNEGKNSIQEREYVY